MVGARHDPDPVAVRLAVALNRLRARMREGAAAGGAAVPPVWQLAILKRLRDHGVATAAELAVIEHVTHQAITRNLAALKRAGLVRSAPDPADGRKRRLRLTPAGSRLLERVLASREAWLTRAIEHAVAPGERHALARAVALIERLADAEDPR